MKPPLYFENAQKSWFVVATPDSGIWETPQSPVDPVLSYPLLIYPSRDRAEMAAKSGCFVVEVKPQ